VIADTSMAALIARASGGRVVLRTTAGAEAKTVLESAGATVTAAGPGVITATGLTAEAIIKILSGKGVPFSEVSAHRASLEDAYLELTRDASEYRAVPAEEVTR
jgi:ABC-2 type transport system ATP-binding protein